VARLLAGWAIAAVFGAAAGIALGLSPVLSDCANPVLAFVRALPPTMLVPLFLVLFHIGTEMQLATIVFGSIWPVLMNAVDGARQVDRTKVETARIFGIGPLRRVLTIVLPSALPKIFAGLRVSLSIALILMVVSEQIGGTDGLGYLVATSPAESDYPKTWAGIVMISALGYLLNRVLVFVERRTLSWHRDQPGRRAANVM
jgi:ABC-type nitrate/sulfonate/bicarbonate transport system permease component